MKSMIIRFLFSMKKQSFVRFFSTIMIFTFVFLSSSCLSNKKSNDTKDTEANTTRNTTLAETTTVLKETPSITEITTISDAKTIGEGTLVSEQFFEVETDKEYIVVTDTDVTTVVDEESFINAVKDVADYGLGDGERIKDVVLDGTNLIVLIDFYDVETEYFTERDIAIDRISSVTDEILGLDEQYYNIWDTITLDFGSIGKAVLNKNMIKSTSYGKYFDFNDDILQ